MDWKTWGLRGGIAAVIVAGLVWALRPDPVAVDLAVAVSGPMRVTVAAEGITRIREPFTVTAPLSGTTTRSPVQVGDRVQRGQTVVAVIQPAEPAFLDARARRQAEAAVAEAEAAVQLAEVNLAHAQADLDYAATQLERNRALAARGTIPQRMLEDSQQLHATAAAALAAARSTLTLNRATLARMQAQLTGPEKSSVPGAPGECCAQITAPVTGTVLEVADPNARLVQAGTPLVTLGDLADLEIEVNLLSADAVRLRPGAEAWVERWGGEGVLSARLRRIDPAAFTRVSALGIEEQRVRVMLDFETPPEARAGLGDRYRVFVRIAVWQGEDVLQLPVSALFRDGGGWAVFRVEEARARLVPVEVGQREGDLAEITAGLDSGAEVIAYPGPRVTDGARIHPRSLP